MDALQNNIPDKPKASKKRKLLLLGLGLAFAGAISFFGIKYWKSRKQTEAGLKEPEIKVPKTQTKTKASSKPAKAKAKPATKTQAAVKTVAKPEPTKTTKPINASAIAKAIHEAVIAKSFAKAFEQLKNVKSVKDYSAVSKMFSQMPVAGVRHTLVNGLLSTFKDEKQKQSFRKAFTAMGLKYDGKKWSLSGTEKPLLITTIPTKVWKNPHASVSVPVNMVLGREITKRGSFTLFENDKQFFLVESKAIRAYQ